MNHIRIKGKITRWAKGGDGVLETDEGSIYVPLVVPGDVVEVELRRKKNHIQPAVLKKIIEPSVHRVKPECNYAEACGGCPWIYGDIGQQHSIKRAEAQKISSNIEWISSPLSKGYRRRARLSFIEGQIGYRAKGSNKIIEIKDCIVLVEPLSQLLTILHDEIKVHLKGEGEIRLVLGLNRKPVIYIESASAQSRALFACLEKLIATNVISGSSVVASGAGRAVLGNAYEYTMTPLGEIENLVSGFSQTNEMINEKLQTIVYSFSQSKDKHILELYAGAGNLTMALAQQAASYIAVETDPDAVNSLKRNAERYGLKIRVIRSDVKNLPKIDAQIIVLDPPRTGAQDALPLIRQINPQRIVYVSCDSRTLQRDLKEISSFGYQITQSVALDMFPHTPHFEMVVLLERG